MIQTIDLSISYSGKRILDSVSLSVPQGQILAIVGPSGCGKSSFLAALNRLTDMIPDAKVDGQVLVDCCDVNSATRSAAELRKCVGMIFQKPNPFDMSIRRNIQLALKEHGVREKHKLEEITESVLRKVGLWDEVADRLNHPAMKLSGGQQQRLCVARAMALRPQVLLMDEPCSALDPISSGTVEELIQSMRGEFTIIVVTHNLAQAKRIADRVAVFWTEGGVGRLIAEGPAAEVFNNPENDNAAAYLAGLQG